MECGLRTRPWLTRGACITCATEVQGGKGWLATIGVGYDYQFEPESSPAYSATATSSLKGTVQQRVLAGEIKQTSAWAVGARVGWLVTPKTMSYVNGGYTGARFSGGTWSSQPGGRQR